MKHKMQTPDNAAHEAAILELEQSLQTEIEVQARHDASSGKPSTESDFRALVVNDVRAHIQEAIDHNHSIYLPCSGIYFAGQIQKESADDIIKLNGVKYETEQRKAALQQRKKRYAPDPMHTRIRQIIVIGLCGISLAEGFLANDSFRNANFPRIMAAMSGFAIAITVGLSIHFVAKHIKRIPNAKQRNIYFGIICAIAFIGFYALAALRANGMEISQQLSAQLQGQEVHTHISAIILCVISFLLFIAAFFFSMMFSKTKEEEVKDKEYNLLLQDERECVKKIQQIEAKINEIKEYVRSKTAEAYQNQERALANENRLKSLFSKLISNYIKINTRHRDDIPSFFSTAPDASFSTFFNAITKYHE